MVSEDEIRGHVNALLGDHLQAAHQEFVEEVWRIGDEFNGKNALRSSAYEHVLLRAAKDSIRKRANLVEAAWRQVLNAFFSEAAFLSPDILGQHAEEVLRGSVAQVEEMLRSATPWRAGSPLDVTDQLLLSIRALQSSLAVVLAEALKSGKAMFKNLETLALELDQLAVTAKASNDSVLQADVHKFVAEVGELADEAFADVHEILGEIGYLPLEKFTEQRVLDFQRRLADTYARDKFKKIMRICERLHALAKYFQAQIEPRLTQAGGVPHSSQLFWLLEKHEGSFIQTIRSSVDEVSDLLDSYRREGGIEEVQIRARRGQKELRSCLDHLTRAQYQMVGALPQGAGRLLDPGKAADELLRRSPWFSGSFFLAAALLILTAVTIVAGNVSLWALPIVLAASFAGLTLVGAFTLMNDNKLSQQTFLQILDLSMRRVLLPLTRTRGN